MAFLKKPLKWTALGQEPSELKKSEGFKMDESPAPGHFDFMFRSTYEAIEELQQKAGEVKTINNTLPNTTGNISVTKSTVGLSNVDNTSDVNKPISNATKTELDKKYTKPMTGIPKTDLSADVQTSLTKAESALQSVPLATAAIDGLMAKVDKVSLDNVMSVFANLQKMKITNDDGSAVYTIGATLPSVKKGIFHAVAGSGTYAPPASSVEGIIIAESASYWNFIGASDKGTWCVGTYQKEWKGWTTLATAKDVSNLSTRITALETSDTTHQADNVSHDTYVSCATASTTAEKVVTVNGFTLVEGARITVNFANANTATTPTLKINTEVAKPLVKADGTAFKNIKAGIYSFVYSGSNFTVQGEGGEYGTATASEVLQGYTLGTENGVVNGVFSSLKSKQSGIVSLSATDTFIDVNISAVNISKSILDVSCSPGNSNETTHATMAVKIEFINTNTIRLTRAKASTSTSTINVSWVVYEFNNVKSLQRGSKTLAATTYNDVSISAVNINKSMIFISYTDTMNATIQSSYITRYFGSSSLITFHCTQPTDKIINWQVIEFY